MQLLCLNACFVLGLRSKGEAHLQQAVTAQQMTQILEQTSASTDFRSLANILDAGPKTRGSERKLYDFGDGTSGDVYRCVLKAAVADPQDFHSTTANLPREPPGYVEENHLSDRASWARAST